MNRRRDVWAEAADFPVLSCDIFDTAIGRILARPADLLLAAGARAEAEGLVACAPDAFAAYRLAAERAARAYAEAAGHDEVRIAEIYDRLFACGIVRDPIRAARVEFEAELAVSIPIEACRAAVAARATGTVVFASDTALPAAWLAELLAACGYGAAPVVFASSDLRRSKHTGRLFPAMLAGLGRPASDMLHVGDNPVSDVARPRAHGIAARLVGRRRAPGEHRPARHPAIRLVDSLLRAAPDPMPSAQHGAEAAGRALARHAAPLLIGFGLHILAEARRHGVTRIYFLARDGHLPLAFIRRLPGRATDGLTLTYLQVSRRSVEAPGALAYLEREGFTAPGRRMIVDVGWRGSLQTALGTLAGLPPDDVVGCYLGLWADALRPGFGPAQAGGYLFAFGHPAPMAACVREGYVVLELLFSAPHGTVVGYDASNAPVHEAAGDTADADRTRAMQAMEAAFLDLADRLGAVLGQAWPEEIDPRSALSGLAPLLTRPTRAELALVNRIPFIHTPEGGTLQPAVNALPLREALSAPRRALKRLDQAPWRAGAVRAALPRPLPGMSFETLRHWVERLLR